MNSNDEYQTYADVGGICGRNALGTIKNCYVASPVTGYATKDANKSVGGICGYNYSGSVIQNCYFLESFIDSAVGGGSGTVTGVVGKDTSEFASGEVTYLLNGSSSDSSVVWRQNLTGNYKTIDYYPVLDDTHAIVGKDSGYYNKYAVNIAEPTNGTVTTNTTIAKAGETVTLTVTPGTGYELDTLTVKNDTSGKNVTVKNNKFTMPSAHVTVTATFKKVTYSVSVTKPTNGTVTTNATATMGDTVTLTVTPGTGYELDTLTVKNNTSGANVTVKNNQFTMPSANVTVTATFKKVAYNVTIYSTNGTVTTNKTTAAMGDTVTLTVTPDEGYELDTLTVTDGSGANVTVTNNQFIMPASNVTATATFKEKAVTIAPQLRINSETNALEVSYDNGTTWTLLGVNVTGEDGAGGVGAGSAAVSENGDLIITLTANAGYTLPETITVKTGDSALTTGYSYDSVTGTVTIPAASIAGDITITAVGTHEHTWGDTGYTWSDDAACTAKRTCTTCSSEETETVTATSETTAATCTTDGSTTYTAAFNVDWATEQTNAVTLPAIGHAWGDVSYTWSDNNKTCTATRTCINANCSATETAEAMVTSETTAATCTTNGQTTYTATFSTEGNWAEVQTESEPVIAAGHSMTHTAMNAATCIEAGNIEYYYCEACKKYFNDEDGAEEITDTNSLTLAATGQHSYDSDYLCTVCGHEKEPAQDSETGKYQISDVREFIWFANLVNGKLDDVEQDTDAAFQLTANIDMSGQSWTPIGTKANPYTGSFDGGGYTISNLRSTSSSSGGYTGLFGYVGEGGTVQNVKLKSVSISSSGKTGYAGVICGYNNGGTIANCTVTGTLSTSGQSGSSGGICGYNAGTITGCTSSVKVTASGKSAYAGGICGYNAKAGTISNCTSSGAVTTSGKSGKAGGICGYNAGKIASCSSTGKIRATGQSGKSGKIYGYNSGKVS